MKKAILTLVAIISIALSADAMTYEQARNEALFLTDKMAYELNLTQHQYEAAYEINLDYLMGVTSRNDVFGTYWERRNLDMSYILLDWQLSAFRAAAYFFRPLYWDAGYWHFRIYARYPRRHYLYFGRPAFYSSYRGGHSWRMNGGRSYYHGRRNHYIHTGSRNHGGMRDKWDKGEFRKRPNHNRGGSTSVTVNHGNRQRGSFGNRNGWSDRLNKPTNSSISTDKGKNNSSRPTTSSSTSRRNGSFGQHSRSGSSVQRSQSTVRPSRSSSSVSKSPSSSSSSRKSSSSSRSSGSKGGGRFGGQR